MAPSASAINCPFKTSSPLATTGFACLPACCESETTKVSGALSISMGVCAVRFLASFGKNPPKDDLTRRMYQITSHF